MTKSIPDRSSAVLRREQAISALFDQHFVPLRRLALALVHDEDLAEEIVMDAFVKVCSRWKSIETLDWPLGYVRKIVINMCRSKLRRRQVERRFLHKGRSDGLGPAGAIDCVFDPVLAGAVRALPERQRTAVVLYYLEDLPVSDIARLMDCSIGTVKSQLHKARSRLAETLDPLEPTSNERVEEE